MKTSHALKKFKDYLIENQNRFTVQKRQIAEEIFHMKHHFEVEEFLIDLRKKNNKISRATVYRTIKQLLDAGFIQRIATRDGKVYYEKSLNQKQHDHLICNTCGRILEIKEDSIESYLNTFCKKLGFQPEYRSLHIYGKCKSCK